MILFSWGCCHPQGPIIRHPSFWAYSAGSKGYSEWSRLSIKFEDMSPSHRNFIDSFGSLSTPWSRWAPPSCLTKLHRWRQPYMRSYLGGWDLDSTRISQASRYDSSARRLPPGEPTCPCRTTRAVPHWPQTRRLSGHGTCARLTEHGRLGTAAAAGAPAAVLWPETAGRHRLACKAHG